MQSIRIPLALGAAAALFIASILPAEAGKRARIRIRSGNATANAVVIDETSTPPTLTISPGMAVRSAPGSLLDLGNDTYEILVAGDAAYHVKTRGGVDSIVVRDGPGSSTYWLGAGADSDTVEVYDGPGVDFYTIEGKKGDDQYTVDDTGGDSEDVYYIKGAKWFDQYDIHDGPGDDLYKFRGSSDGTVTFTDAAGDLDTIRAKGVSVAP